MGRKKRNKQQQQQAQQPYGYSRPSPTTNNTEKTTETNIMQNQQTPTTQLRLMTQIKESPGILTCTFKHQVAGTTANIEWHGPKISRDVWNQVLAFLKWTYDTTHSESQIRLFVNRNTQQWAAWAFPQRARTGMTTKELDTPDVQERLNAQRALFNPADGWMYFGTVHHHCSGGAFQSGTDEANERSQDGIHITVGFMDKDWYDIDYRFYLSGLKLTDFDLSMLWQVETDYQHAWAQIPAPLRVQPPADALKRLAMYEMGRPAPSETEFPAEWKENMVFDVPVVVRPAATVGQIIGRHDYLLKALFSTRSKGNWPYDLGRATEELLRYTRDNKVVLLDLMETISEIEMFMSLEHLDVADILLRNDVTPAAFLAHVEKAKEQFTKQDEERKAASTVPQQQQQVSEGGKPLAEMTEEEMWAAYHGGY